MYVFDNRNYKFNQTLLKLLGLWPYAKTKFQRLRAICFNALLFSYVIVQIKQILERIINDWRMLTDVWEIKIMEYYAYQGKRITIFFMLVLLVALSSFIVLTIIPDILDFVSPLNKSRLHYLPSVNEYHGYQVHFYPVFLYVMASTVTGLLTVISVISMFLLIILHCCAILKISSYHMKHSVDEEVILRSDRKKVIVERIIKSVKLHQNVQKLIEMFMSNYVIILSILVLIGVISLSINLYRLLQAIIYMDNFPEFLAAFTFVIGNEFLLFVGNYSGQLIIDHANDLFNAIYKSLWYIAPMSVQKLLLFMMQCNVKSCKLNVGNLFVASLEGFTSLSSMSMSYFTVIYSTQQFNK